jgi:hypothetical protein
VPTPPLSLLRGAQHIIGQSGAGPAYTISNSELNPSGVLKVNRQARGGSYRSYGISYTPYGSRTVNTSVLS